MYISYLYIDIASVRGATSDSRDSRQLTGTMSSLTATMDSSTWGTSSSKWTSSDRKERLSVDDEEGEIIMRCCALYTLQKENFQWNLNFAIWLMANLLRPFQINSLV